MLREMPVDFTSATWPIARRSIAMPVLQARSGDNPAAVHFLLHTKSTLLLYIFEKS
jgi:hypothetical protein